MLPKKPVISYLWFLSANVRRIIEEEKILKYTDGVKRVGEIWNTMNLSEKKNYINLAAKDKKRY